MNKLVKIEDKNYPKLLKKIGTLAPKTLYYKGDWNENIFANCLAVVGSRHLTSYGRRTTEQLVSQIASAGVTIVSGFMYGGDEAAHSATVKAGGKTIAVMPCGIDTIHPIYQKDLYNKIIDGNGLIISEYGGKFLPQMWTYVQRNRIVAGLSKAILVVEAGLDSGSLITANYSKKFGRKVFAVPGPITSEVSKGTIKLIKEGAEIVTGPEDILKYFNISFASPKNKNCNAVGLEQEIINQLKREPMQVDAIARALALPASKIGTALSLMQLKGFISQDSGKYYIN